MNGKYYYGTGRRKSSVARVFLAAPLTNFSHAKPAAWLFASLWF